MEQHHYLGYEQPVGEHLKYLVWAQGRPIACLAWRSRRAIWAAATATSAGARKRGGATSASSPTTRVSDSALGSGAASGVAHSGPDGERVLSDDWQRMYGHPIYFAETFIDPGAISRNLLPCGQLAVAWG